MSSYNHFAFVYDDLTENVEYEKRFHYMMSFFKEYNIQNGARILDLACGTGSFSLLFANAGYRVTGMDASEQMLTVADSKCGGRANFLKGDMCSFRLSEMYDGCICCMDSINHLSDLEQVEHAFRCVGSSLKKTDCLFLMSTQSINTTTSFRIMLLFLMRKTIFWHGIMKVSLTERSEFFWICLLNRVRIIKGFQKVLQRKHIL